MLVFLFLTCLLISQNQSAIAQSSAGNFETADSSLPDSSLPDSSLSLSPTTTADVWSGNPIKLSIVKGAPSSDLPLTAGDLGVSDVVSIGLKYNLVLQQSEKSWTVSKYLSRSALAKLGPSATFSTYFASSSIDQMLFFPSDSIMAAPMQPVTRGSSLYALFAGVQPLFTGGRLLGGLIAARAQERQQFHLYRANRFETALKIKEAYWRAALAEAKIKVDTDYVKSRELSVYNMRARLEQGKVPRADYLREEAELARARAQVNEDYRAFNTELLDLKVRLGVNITSLITLKDKLEFVEKSGELAGYLVDAGQERPEIARAKSRIREMKAKRMIALSKYSPQVYLYGLGSNATGPTPGVDGSANGRWGATLGIMGSINLFDSGSRWNELRAATTSLQEAEIARREAELKVAQEVSQSWIDLELARRNVDLARSEVASAEEDKRLFHARYLVGKSIALEDFDAGVKLLQARLELLKALYDYRMAEAGLVWATGKI